MFINLLFINKRLKIESIVRTMYAINCMDTSILTNLLAILTIIVFKIMFFINFIQRLIAVCNL